MLDAISKARWDDKTLEAAESGSAFGSKALGLGSLSACTRCVNARANIEMFSHAVGTEMHLMYLAVNDRKVAMAYIAAAPHKLGVCFVFSSCLRGGLRCARLYIDSGGNRQGT